MVTEVNWRDNPWFPEILRKQLEDMKTKDYDNYLTVWEGKTRRSLDGRFMPRNYLPPLLKTALAQRLDTTNLRALPSALILDDLICARYGSCNKLAWNTTLSTFTETLDLALTTTSRKSRDENI